MKTISVRIGDTAITLDANANTLQIMNGESYGTSVLRFTEDLKSTLIAFVSLLIEAEEGK